MAGKFSSGKPKKQRVRINDQNPHEKNYQSL